MSHEKRSGPRSVVPVLLIALATASIAGAWLLVSSTVGYSFDDDAWVSIDGEEHVVAVDRDELTMVWRDETFSQPQCEVRDEAGATLPLRPVSGRYSRHAGSAGDWVGAWTFTPTTETVTVTCTGARSSPTAQVPVTTAPSSATTPEERLLRRGAAVLLAILAAISAAAAFRIWRRRPSLAA